MTKHLNLRTAIAELDRRIAALEAERTHAVNKLDLALWTERQELKPKAPPRREPKSKIHLVPDKPR